MQTFLKNVVGRFSEETSGGRQCGRITAAVDQVGSDPLFERLDPPAETGLRDIANLSGSRETLVLGKSHKVLDPFNLHIVPCWLLIEKRVFTCWARQLQSCACDGRCLMNGKASLIEDDCMRGQTNLPP